MHTNTIDHDQLECIEAGDAINDDRYLGCVVLCDIKEGDTTIAAPYEDATLDALLTPVDEDTSVDMETCDDRQSTVGFAAGTSIDQ